MAWSIWRTPVAERAAQVSGGSDLMRCFAGTFVLTLSNPATILSFIAVFGVMAGRAAVSLADRDDRGCLDRLGAVVVAAERGGGPAARALRRALAPSRQRGVGAGAGGFALWQFAALAPA